MKTKLAVLGLCMGLCALFVLSVTAGPSLPVTKPPVQPTDLRTGPPVDPTAAQGQWFRDAVGTESNRTHEFHDNTTAAGGGNTNELAISGVVDSVSYEGDGSAGDPIIGFIVKAGIRNDLTSSQTLYDSANSHTEFRQLEGSYVGPMLATKLAVEFAVADSANVPSEFVPPYRPLAPLIEAVNEHQTAWYCWNPDAEPKPAGGYYVPVWDFGNINPGESMEVALDFSIPGGLPSSDPRHAVIEEAFRQKTDIFLNRFDSLKISTWMDDIALDEGQIHDESPLRMSNVSVFHNIEEEAEDLDFGDAPEDALAYPASGIPGTFPTCKNVPLAGWIQHGLGWAHFGPTWDAEADGNAGLCPVFNPNSYDQDECFADNDAGLITPPSYTITGLPGAEVVVPCTAAPGAPLGTACQTASWGPNVDILVVNGMPPGVVGYVNVLMDWDQNGAWGGVSSCPGGAAASEHVLVNFPVPTGYAGPLSALQPLPFLIGPNSGHVWCRFSITERPVLLPWTGEGQFEDGETEDYLLEISPGQQVDLDFGDAPDPTYPTLLINNGARHVILFNAPWFGDATDVPDPERDGQPDPNALGDDNAGNDDEDAITFSNLMVGQPGSVTFEVNGAPAGGAQVDAWIDWNANGLWEEPAERIIGSAFTSGVYLVVITPPAGTQPGTTFARFRINSVGLLPPTGLADDGEVEDNEVTILEPEPEALDFGDAPDPTYPTLLANNGARHVLVPGGPWFGDPTDVPDAETDGQPDAAATGDDKDLLKPLQNDDEDGVVFSALIAGQQGIARFSLNCPAGSAYVDAWIDWNMDGVWGATERIISGWFGPGLHSVPVTPPGPNGTSTFARFRVNSTGSLGPTGPAADGEVEDLVVQIAPVKWLQPPDLTTNGVDVANTLVHLADDFLCTASGPITDIHIWTSLYKNEWWAIYTNLSFSVFLYTDVPAGPDNLYSHPGELIWSRKFAPGEYQGFFYSSGTDEWWHDPLQNMWEYPGDSMVFEYDFYIPEGEAFVQTRGTIYWLGVKYDETEPAGVQLGWKTSSTNWNDDACWLDESTGLQTWRELRYGDAHPLAGKSMDFAFAVTGVEDAAPEFDFGDAPEGALAYPASGTFGNFPTCTGVSPAAWIQHGLGWARFGQGWDAESDGNAGLCPLFNPNAYDQDECFNDGDAGLMYPDSYTIVGLPGTETVVGCPVPMASNALGKVCQPAAWGTDLDIYVINNMPVPGYVNVLMDWDQNGAWGGFSVCPPAGAAVPEHILVNFQVPVGYNAPLSGLLPPNFVIGPNPGHVWCRFSITEQPVMLPWTGDGQFEDGETEDYLLRVDPAVQIDLDFGDAPDPTYPTLLANNGANHVYVPGVCMGKTVDTEADGQPDAFATGDDVSGAFDEDGFTPTSPFYAGGSGTFDVECSVNGFLSVWIDFNADGDWTDAGENIFVTNAVIAGTNTFAFVIPGTAVPGQTFMRLRFTTQQIVLADTGQAPDGEVEDHRVTIQEEIELLDFGDAWDTMTGGGYPTLLANNGARHGLLPGVFLGNGVDLEPDGQPDPNALGDDQNLFYPGIPFPPGDEDGVIIPPLLIAGSVAQVQVFASAPGFLNAWIDFNANGTWIDPGEQVFFNWLLNPGPNILSLPIPPYPATQAGGPHSRWRFTTYPPMFPAFTGAETDGEVEDYEVRLEVLDFGDAPDPLYPTLLVNDGARHRMPSAYYLGIAPDDEPDGQPDAQALGDDNANVDDEDLVTTLAKAVQGETKTIVATASTNGFLNIWIDFDQNGSWDASEQVVSDQALVPGANNVVFTTPQAAKLGTTFARVRFCSYRGLGPTGFATDGEVEDYEIAVFQNGPDPSTFRITNIVYSAPSTAAIWWASTSNVTYQTQWASNLLSDSNVTWTVWGSDVIGPTNTQIDPNAAASTRFYRVVAPFAPPPP